MTAIAATRPIRVVLADDIADIRLLLRANLQARGNFEVVAEAGDGLTAIDAVVHHRPDVIVLDLSMPVLDGLEAIPVLRQRVPECAIVVLSGFDASRMADQTLGLGADAYLTKGTRPDEIAAAIRRVVDTRSPAAAYADGLLVNGWAAPIVDGGRSIEVAYRSQNDLLPMLAHELLNSITVIAGYAATLRTSPAQGSPEMVERCAEVIERHAAQMEALIRCSRDARSMEVGTLELGPAVIDLEAASREALEDLARVIAPHPVEVAVRGRPQVTADPVRLRQVMTNLLSNAAKFSPPEGLITVTVGSSGAEGLVTVADEGPGVATDKRVTVFEKFGRLDHRVPGSGLGLYVARGLAIAQGGDLRLLDSPRGACFALTLPLASAPPPPGPLRSGPPPVPPAPVEPGS